MKAIHRSTRDHSIQFFSRLLFLLLVVNTLINLLIGGISRNFIKHQNMLHLEDSIHIYADSLNTELHSVIASSRALLIGFPTYSLLPCPAAATT